MIGARLQGRPIRLDERGEKCTEGGCSTLELPFFVRLVSPRWFKMSTCLSRP